MLLCIGIISAVVAYSTPTALSHASKGQTALVVVNIVGGLGDIGWAANIGRELKKATGIQPTYLFVGSIAWETIEHLNKRSDLGGAPEIIHDLSEVEPGQIGVYVCETAGPTMEDPDPKEIDAVGRKFDCIVLFCLDWKALSALNGQSTNAEKKFIPVEEYGGSVEENSHQRIRIFFQDYKEKYGLAVSEEDCVRLKLSADEFYNRLGEKAKKQFNLEYVKELEKKIGVGVPYNFVYYNLFARRNTFDNLVILLKRSLVRIAKLQGQNNKNSDKPITFLVNQLDLDREAKLEEDPQKALAQAHITFGSDGVQQLYLAEINKTVRLVSYANLSPEAFEYFLLKSELVAGCTGDMSLTQVLSSKRIPVYEVLPHKQCLYTDGLNAPWIEALQEIDISVEKDLEAFPGLEEDATKVSFSGMKVLTPENVRQAYPIFHSKLLQNAFSPWFKKRVEEIMKTKEPKQHLLAEHSDKSLSDSYSNPKPMITSSA
ncbi:hypothetical protein NEHOM01_2227 [Nematocida homosporus]|uniref:uncharacterized protein n=1 Tax=Nematocida homosporus TaxID=1912981 RepID=UPI00222094A2|nr:uncharacterized protein NEHOM01_2227 [Nematocida homosporus]KAI5187504.1 hypothetical protein NEHOM01_2227 [Nematocida homosporus]